ncbi:MAG: glycosyltransferase family 2 protein [Armatimonadetes bacterium]|nr:glycosyltransferase family 2 protein [Armatimonadota bacterium]
MADMRLSIIIVNWNTRELLLRCVESIRQSIKGLSHEIIVIDNGSTDGSVEAVRARFPDAHLIANDTNLGFAAANNLGLEKATGEIVLLLNPDTTVPPDAIGSMLDFLSGHPEVGIVGPRLVGSDGEPQISSFGMFPSVTEAALHALRIWRIAPRSSLAKRFLVRPEEGEDWAYAAHLLGACLLMPRKVIDEIGGFDEGFFLFLEETDLCCRARKAGYKLAYYTGASIVHLGEQSMQNILNRSGGLYIRSYNRFCAKHGMGLAQRLLVNGFLVVGSFVEAGMGVVKYRSLRRAKNSLGALWYGYVASP